MFVEDDTVEQIEDVTRYDGGHCHEAPVLRETVNAEALRHDRGKDAEEKAVAQTREAGDETEEVGVDHVQCEELGNGEDGSGDDKTPHSACVEEFDQKIGADA